MQLCNYTISHTANLCATSVFWGMGWQGEHNDLQWCIMAYLHSFNLHLWNLTHLLSSPEESPLPLSGGCGETGDNILAEQRGWERNRSTDASS